MSADVQQALALSSDKADARAHKDPLHRRPSFHLIHKRHKEDIKHQCRFCRKRNQKLCQQDKHCGGGGGPSVKRRKKEVLIPPTKFLLGGNIRDPLNLNSLRDEEVNRRLNAVTPETSPMPTPQWRKGEVEVLLPPNIHDPLNLEGGPASPHLYLPAGGAKRGRKKHKKKRSKDQAPQLNSEEAAAGDRSLDSSGCSDAPEDPPPLPSVAPDSTPGQVPPSERLPPPGGAATQPPQDVFRPPPPTTLPLLPKNQDPSPTSKKGKGSNSKKTVDKIVSPVVKQPGACGTSGQHRRKQQQVPHQAKGGKPQAMPRFKESNRKYQYGNYNRYYGYRNADYEMDPRLRLLETRRDLFEDKEVLDVGCNTGHITLAIASDMAAARVVGLDLDRRLVEAARGNIKHYVRRVATRQAYPASMPLLYGPLPRDSTPPQLTRFPHNVSFVQGNYVVGSDVLVDLEVPQFDTVLCLSVTKWFHLNWGDSGLKRALRRVYKQLRPGGVLVLEPQPWSSYAKKKNITETTWKNYQSIELFPQKFTQFLLNEVGFVKCEVLGSPAHTSRGFERPIKLYYKGFDKEETDDDKTEDRLGKNQEAGLSIAGDTSKASDNDRPPELSSDAGDLKSSDKGRNDLPTSSQVTTPEVIASHRDAPEENLKEIHHDDPLDITSTHQPQSTQN